MKRLTFIILYSCCNLLIAKANAGNIWHSVNPTDLPKNIQLMHPRQYLTYLLDETQLKTQFLNLSSNPAEAGIVTLPLPDGTFRDFKVWHKTMMPDELAAKYPDIKTYTGQAINNATITVKLDFTVYGFHAMIFDGEKTAFIDPYDLYHDNYYMVHYLKDETRPAAQRMNCIVNNTNYNFEEKNNEILRSAHNLASRTANGNQLRTYRLALSADAYYCQAATGAGVPSIGACLSAMTTSMNRINGVFERELSVTMVFVAHEDTLIFPTAAGSINGSDPFYSFNTNANSCLANNQTFCDARIGTANYDIGHVFTTGAGGLSEVGCVCNSATKAQSVTGQPTPVGDGFDINYVAHEMGHEFGADHPFNDNADMSCGGNAVDYSGICAPDDIQANSDAYFSAVGLVQINTCITTTGDACAVKTSTLNRPVHIDSFAHNYSIPYLTPFELTAPIAIDSTTDTLTTYCWDQWNLGDFGLTFAETHNKGPLFRSLNPVAYPSTRVFPRPDRWVNGILNDAGNENNQGEKLPDVARYLTFKLTMRDIYLGNGCFLFPDDTVHLDVINTGAAFTISSQATTGIVYNGGSTQTVTWNIVNTVNPPISTPFVDIYMSIDGGYNWMYHIGTFENTGGAIVTVPNPPVSTTTARFKVKGKDNVFFNINATDFAVNYNASLPVTAAVNTTTPVEPEINIYPNPTNHVLHIATTSNTAFQVAVFNTLGQQVWHGIMNKEFNLPISNWAKGIYYIHFSDSENRSEVKKFVVE